MENKNLKHYDDGINPQRPFIFFDIGSTLMDGPDLSPASRFMKELDLSPSDKEIINSFIFTEDITDPEHLISRFRELLPSLPENAGETVKHVWNAQMSDGFVIEGAMEALKSLSEKGYRMGIISNIWHPYYLCFERLFAPVMDKFEKIILSYRTGFKKPDERIFWEALSSLSHISGINNKFHNSENNAFREESKEMKVVSASPQNLINPSSAAIVGDSYHHDIAPAIKIGMKTIWVLREYKREAKFLRDILLGKISGPDVAVGEVGELSLADV